jgi:hypothetical protein
MPQADYTVSASQSGSAYASDVNDALLAIQTNNSGSTAPSDLDAFMGWADTTTNFLKTRDAGNTTWYTQFPLNKNLSTYINELVLVHGLGGTAPLKSGDDLNSVDQTGFYRITTSTTNNTYGNGSVLVVNRGSGVVDQLILSITDSKLYLRNTANSGSLWTLKATMGDAPTLNSLLPSQTGNSGKFLTTNGTNASWANVRFATMNADFSTLANLAGTYSRTGTLVTVSATAHGHITGHSVYVDFLTGGALDGWYDVTYVDANTFTLNTVASGTIAGGSTLNLLRNSTRAVNGFTNFLPYEAGSRGYVFVPFSTLAPTANYTINCTAGGVTYLEAPHIGTRGATFINPTTAGFYMSLYSGGFSSGNVTPPYVHIEVNA